MSGWVWVLKDDAWVKERISTNISGALVNEWALGKELGWPERPIEENKEPAQ